MFLGIVQKVIISIFTCQSILKTERSVGECIRTIINNFKWYFRFDLLLLTLWEQDL